MLLKQLIDSMIDRAEVTDPSRAYNILLGAHPATEKRWLLGQNVYRSCPVVQTRLVPNYEVVLAPTAEDLGRGELYEYHGRILNGDVTRYTI